MTEDVTLADREYLDEVLPHETYCYKHFSNRTPLTDGVACTCGSYRDRVIADMIQDPNVVVRRRHPVPVDILSREVGSLKQSTVAAPDSTPVSVPGAVLVEIPAPAGVTNQTLTPAGEAP